jgi:hypothetical protein
MDQHKFDKVLREIDRTWDNIQDTLNNINIAASRRFKMNETISWRDSRIDDHIVNNHGRIYIILCTSRNAPERPVVHYNKSSALNELTRLARQSPNQRFIIFESTVTAISNNIEIKEIHDGVPPWTTI